MADLQELLNDIERERKRAAQAKFLDTKSELANNVYPLLTAIVETLGEELNETQDALGSLISGGESIIQPHLAEQIIGLIGLGLQMCDRMVATAVLDEETKQMIEQFKAGCNLVMGEVQTATMFVDENEEDEEGEEGDEEDEEDEEEADFDEEETTPVERPRPAPEVQKEGE